MNSARALVAWNPPLVLAVLALGTVQLFKFFRAMVTTRTVDFQRLLGMGGMPSSHAASVAALGTSVGLGTGWSSPLFGVTAFFCLMVMYDAAGIRRAAGRQARVLNRMLDDLREHHSIEGERLIELLGHTPTEVLTGTAYGVALALVLHP